MGGGSKMYLYEYTYRELSEVRRGALPPAEKWGPENCVCGEGGLFLRQ